MIAQGIILSATIAGAVLALLLYNGMRDARLSSVVVEIMLGVFYGLTILSVWLAAMLVWDVLGVIIV